MEGKATKEDALINNLQLFITKTPYLYHCSKYLRKLKSYDYDTYLHSHRVADLAVQIGVKIELTKPEINQLMITALLHDIGKIKIPLGILRKTNRLNNVEWSEIIYHPEYGANIISNCPVIFPQDIIEGIYSHHEYYNGHGYPNKIKGESIPIYARVIAIADAIDAMTNPRPYRPIPLPYDEALRVIQIHSGSQFDTYLVNRL